MLPFDDDVAAEWPEPTKPGWPAVIITIFVIVALLSTLIWPLLSGSIRRPRPPTPTPAFIFEARAALITSFQ